MDDLMEKFAQSVEALIHITTNILETLAVIDAVITGREEMRRMDRLQCLIKDWVESYDAIEILSVNNVVSNEDYAHLRNNLFEKIIDTLKEEVSEWARK